MRNGLLLCGMIVFGSMCGAQPSRAAPLTEDMFQLRTTGDLVALCGAPASDPMYTPAQNFCHGFAVGTYRLAMDVENGTRAKTKMFCPPATKPVGRSESIAAFVQWASAHGEVMSLSPTDGLLRFMAYRLPCK